MNTVTTAAELKSIVNNFRSQGKIIGFVPTMGALHQGHISLVKRAKSECNVVISSIFVNPTQFNDKKDLEKYPRTYNKDAEMLQNVTCDILFYPSEKEIYPEPDTRVFDFGNLGNVMEGSQRPGHFNGVAQVVSRLFNIVQPHKAYFGEKDFQQLAIIKQLVKQLSITVQIIPCPTLREADGLAMSSRNVRLSPEERKAAPLIAQTLFKVKELYATKTIKELSTFAKQQIGTQKLMELEYFEIVNATTLQPADTKGAAGENVACIALRMGSTRLIDNIIL